eukprot:scaffold51633_cov63-Phaeocystis_antarctica.AAC.1
MAPRAKGVVAVTASAVAECSTAQASHVQATPPPLAVLSVVGRPSLGETPPEPCAAVRRRTSRLSRGARRSDTAASRAALSERAWRLVARARGRGKCATNYASLDIPRKSPSRYGLHREQKEAE